MGDLDKYRDVNLSRDVVIKKLKDGQDDQRMVDELKALSKLRSKHVVQLFDILNQNGKVEIVLEYIDGQNLSSIDFKTDTEYMRILWQIADGLDDIHKSGIIHRDIKPQNIRLDQAGVIKILDFGLARENNNAHTQSIIGTPGFMAPELWKSSNISFDKTIDIYAFAVTAIALILKDLPIQLKQIPPEHVPEKDIQKILAGIPDEIISLVSKSINNPPKHRPDIKNIKTSLEKYLLRDRHKALLVMPDSIHEISKDKREVQLKAGNTRISIQYDGFDFKVSYFEGDVTVNNMPVLLNTVLPKCCVITFEAKSSNRAFVTFDVSNPEVIS
jgi:serine/threonine protein kinase